MLSVVVGVGHCWTTPISVGLPLAYVLLARPASAATGVGHPEPEDSLALVRGTDISSSRDARLHCVTQARHVFDDSRPRLLQLKVLLRGSELYRAEAKNAQKKMFSLDRFAEVLRAHKDESSQSLRNILLESLKSYLDGVPLNDDLTLLIAEIASPAES